MLDNKVIDICHCDTLDEFHHARFGGEAIYTEDRNDPKELVLLCHSFHNRLHFEGSSNWMRQECIIYLNRIYGKIQS